MHWIAPSEKGTDSAALEKRFWDAAVQFGAKVNAAMRDIEKHNPQLAGIHDMDRYGVALN